MKYIDQHPFISNSEDDCSYSKWTIKNIPHAVQVSFPRSGRRWLAALICESAGLEQVELKRMTMFLDSDKGDARNVYFTTHHINIIHSDAKYILLIRDPRDLFISFLDIQYLVGKKDAWEDLDYLEDMAKFWVEYHIQLMELDPLVVQYERLCLYPEKEVKRVLEHIDVPAIRDIESVVMEISSSQDKYVSGVFVGNIQDKLSEIDSSSVLHNRETPFEDGKERYEKCCLTWLKDLRSTNRQLDIAWKATRDFAIGFGYLDNGHSEELLGSK